jgi:hypothetical protein
MIKLKQSSQLIGQFGHVTASAVCKQPEKHSICTNWQHLALVTWQRPFTLTCPTHSLYRSLIKSHDQHPALYCQVIPLFPHDLRGGGKHNSSLVIIVISEFDVVAARYSRMASACSQSPHDNQLCLATINYWEGETGGNCMLLQETSCRSAAGQSAWRAWVVVGSIGRNRNVQSVAGCLVNGLCSVQFSVAWE